MDSMPILRSILARVERGDESVSRFGGVSVSGDELIFGRDADTFDEDDEESVPIFALPLFQVSQLGRLQKS